MAHNRIQQLKAMLADEPQEPFLHYALALEYRKLADKVETVNHFTVLLRDFPDYLPTYYAFGTYLAEAGETKEALICLHKGFALAQSQAESKTAREIRALIEELEM